MGIGRLGPAAKAVNKESEGLTVCMVVNASSSLGKSTSMDQVNSWLTKQSSPDGTLCTVLKPEILDKLSVGY